MSLTEGLTSEEKNAIEELQIRTKCILTSKLREDSSIFYRFSKARDFDVDKAEKMLRKHITWRKIHQVDTILEDFKPKEYFHKYVLPSFIGLDKDGDVVMYCASGKHEAAEARKCEKFNNDCKCWIWYCEENTALLKKQSQETGRNCIQITYIIDLDKLTFSNVTQKATTEFWLHLTHLFQDNYPERMKAVYVINAPSYYVLLYSLLKAVMSDAMARKIHVLGHNGVKQLLLSIIDADVLPAFLGGNRTDPDGNPLCLSFVNHCGKIPPEYFLSEEDRYFKDISQVEKTIVPHNEKKEIDVNVTEKGSRIHWEYLVKSKDIGFGLFFQNPGRNIKEIIIPIERYSTADGTQIGTYKSQAIGKYIIIFDNSHSWMSSKEIEYCVTVTKPE